MNGRNSPLLAKRLLFPLGTDRLFLISRAPGKARRGAIAEFIETNFSASGETHFGVVFEKPAGKALQIHQDSHLLTASRQSK